MYPFWMWSRGLTFTQRLQFLVGGQSNASGRGVINTLAARGDASTFAFGNDYTWQRAQEPIDDPTSQVDAISDDVGFVVPGVTGHGFAMQAMLGLITQGRRLDLIPCAKGGSTLANWAPGADRLNRATLYGSANYRRTQAAVATLTAILWFGHESDAGSATYATDWANLVAAFRTDFGATVPFVYCQLAKHTTSATNTQHNNTSDVQRRQETGSGDALALTNMRMVVTFDQPLIDNIHLNDTAQRVVGQRMALAIRQHVLSEAVDGTGPRLNGAPVHPGGAKNQVKIDTTQTLQTIASNADGQFRVYDGASEMTISSVVRDPADASAVLVTMAATAAGTVTVSYGDVAASGSGVTLANVVRNGAGLPLPRFGALTVV